MAKNDPASKGRIKRGAAIAQRARWLAVMSAVGLLLPPLSQWLASSETTLAWLIDMASHWQWLFLSALVLCTGLAAVPDRRWAALMLFAPLPWLTAATAAPDSEAGVSTLRVATVNLNLHNPDTRPLARWLAGHQADAVVLLEVTPAHAEQLEAFDEYRHREVVAQSGPFGIAILARHPLRDSVVDHNDDGIAHIQSRLRWRGETIALYAVHPMPPLTAAYRRDRDARLRALAEHASAHGLPAVVAGDLNATPWSSAFAGLAERGLRRASGLLPTWPASLRGLLGIPVDHVLVSRHWSVVRSEVGPDLGSDHLPLLVELARAPHADRSRDPRG